MAIALAMGVFAAIPPSTSSRSGTSTAGNTAGMAALASSGFSLSLRTLEHTRTEVTLRTHYTPRGPINAAINALMMKRQFGKVCDGIVGGLKTFAEARHRAGQI